MLPSAEASTEDAARVTTELGTVTTQLVGQSEQLMRTVLQRAGATLDWQPVYRGTSGA